MEHTALVLGSIAFDYLMKFDGRFRDVILPDSDKNLTGSLNVSSLRVRYGGTAGNISYNLALLGVKAIAISSAGGDFAAMRYDEHLKKAGVILRLTEYHDEHTAAAYIISDIGNNQLTIFHPGALRHASEISISRTIEGESSRIKIAIVAPNPVDAFVNHTRELLRLKIPFIFDPGQVTPAFTEKQLMEIIPNSSLLIANSHEIELVKRKLNLSMDALVKHVPHIIVTEGARGSRIFGDGYSEHIPIAKPRVYRDPTGAGDGYRAGLIWGLLHSLSLEDSAKIGAVVGSFVVEGEGPQEHVVTVEQVKERFTATFNRPLDAPKEGRR